METIQKDILTHFDQLLAGHDFVFLVYYRGHWCPFCCSYIADLQKLVPAITKRNGIVVAVTAEDESHASSMRKATGYEGEIIVDPEHQLASKLKDDGIVHVATSPKQGYPNGFAQPAVVVMKQDRNVLYQWAIVPSLMNMGGAKDRPALDQIWDNVEAQLDHKPIVHKKVKTQGALGVFAKKIAGH